MIFLHLVNHWKLHRERVVDMLRQLGVKAPTRNLIPFLRELQAAASA